MKFYVYKLIDPRNNKPFYIGKGQNKRMYQHVKNVKRGKIPNKSNVFLYRKINRILNLGLRVKYNKVFETNNENEAYKKETEIINEIGIKNLCNLIWSGGTYSGKIPWNKGKKNCQVPWNKGLTKETDLRIKSYWDGKTRSEETKNKISLTKQGSIPWNKGKKGSQVAWNKGLTKESNPNLGGRKKTGINIICPICLTEFYVPKYQIDRRVVCSELCQHEWQRRTKKGKFQV